MYKNVWCGAKVRFYPYFCTDLHNLTFVYYKYFYININKYIYVKLYIIYILL